MPFAFDDPQDVWSRIERVKNRFTARDAIMDEAAGVLAAQRLVMKKNGRDFDDKTGYGYLQAQVEAATIRVALPYELKLPTLPTMSENDKVVLENTEQLLNAFVQMA